LIVTMVGLTLGWRPAGAQGIIFDNRVDWTARPNGTVGFLGDSVGYGLVTIANITSSLATQGWGPVRSYSLAGLHAAPEGTGDPHNVATWIGNFRAQGIMPRTVVVVVGANDVGWGMGGSVARNQQRIETAMAALGQTEVVWTTLTHHNPSYESAWNQALANADARWANLHVCDWRALARSGPGYLSSDQVHATGNGYRSMRDLVLGCVNTYGSRARTVPAPPLGTIPAAGPAGKLAQQSPNRVLDTRSGGGLVGGGTARRVHVALPGSSAAALNLTAIGNGNGFLTAYPCNRPRPSTSSLNFRAFIPAAAGVTVGVDPAGDVCVYSSATTHLLVDVQGVYRPTNPLGFNGLPTPTRLADTRSGARVGPGAPLVVPVGGKGAWLNLTAVSATGGGFLTAYPCSGIRPAVSNVNYTPGGQAVANAATVAADAAGRVCIFASAPTHVIVDLAGRFGDSGASFVPAVPRRVLDTRGGAGGWQGSVRISQLVTVNLNGVVPAAASGVVATVTAIPDRRSHVTAYYPFQPTPVASNLNPPAWTPTANAASVYGRSIGTVGSGHGYHILDVTGWWQ
jgi:hypothetical protein